MISIKDFKQKKLVIQLVKDLEEILSRINITNKSLSQYKHYKPVSHILVELTNNRAILEAHLNKYKRFLEEAKKGKE